MTKFKTVAELLEDPKRWTKGAFARDAKGDEVKDPGDPSAVCWCLVGAMSVVYREGSRFVSAYERLKDIILEQTGQHMSSFNDAPETTHEDLMRIVRMANI